MWFNYVKAREFSYILVLSILCCFMFCWLAERKSSLGHDWHPNCLRCESCKRMLNPGRHSEVLYGVRACICACMCAYIRSCVCVCVCALLYVCM